MDDAWLDTVRIARDLGQVSVLFPDGVTSLHDIPYPLHDAIRAALHYLSYEELPPEERPPKAIWMDNERMEAWWAEVRRNREAEARGEGSTRNMERNDYAEMLVSG